MIESTCAVFLTHAQRCLFSAYPFVMNKNPLRTLTWFARQFGDRPVIMDSGLFTFFRDARQRGSDPSRKCCDAYFERYKRVLSLIPDHWLVVEFDTHAFDVEVEPYRKWIADSGYADRTIHVWHSQDGQSAFPLYYERFRRVGFSQEGLERDGKGNAALDKMLASTRKVREGRHTHILGTAKERLFAKCHDGFSADATTWTNIAIYGETRCGPERVKYDAKSKKITGPQEIIYAVNLSLPKMMNYYRDHPKHTRKRLIRVNYLRQLAAGLLCHTRYVERLRAKSPGYRPNIVDPIQYWN